ncbi:methyl-accepting chemotaxis protein [Herbaspirillum sp.]|jgi:methyl-accepting chemotaxis protein|uniref:methyl-accepting chemotaxis protein n=1 Tax=Herbaspirillum TaxID=963 RepID=UPI002586F515|nr:methyl-accepting chemotaxis protein [Herbaspirillum sp.]MCP3653791.1 HAMP domain-containing protein [Herbaspirillum sp.]MCP3947276.1 HAMP domain-containing protein [Herbaspirillum sp.]MCP4032648.1 HAMP domain-containing protein [Herbaspirillum sp.]MCP4555748.1 HAMP domain-containing protein [Herbaspirillum sp.]
MSIYKYFSMRQIVSALSVVVALLLALLVALSVAASEAEDRVAIASERREQAQRLVAELRQGADDLSRLARSFVATGEYQAERQYQAIAEIRDGRRPRPEHYERIYWDLVDADGRPPRPDSAVIVPLGELMQQAGFSRDEMAKVEEVRSRSGAVLAIELRAMELVRRHTRDRVLIDAALREDPLEQARRLLHDPRYELARAAMMRPLEALQAMLDTRTRADILQARQARERLDTVVAAVGGLLLLVMIVSVASLYRLVTGPLSQAAQVASRVAKGDLCGRIDGGFQGETGQLLSSLQDMRQGLSHLVREVRHGARVMRGSAGEIAEGALNLTTRATQQAGSLQQAAAAMEQLNQAVQQSADRAQQACSLTRSAAQAALEGGVAVSEMVGNMHAVHLAAGRIEEIVAKLDGLSSQTNLLALNAAVEAAHAGTHGQAFSVVADEVRQLARRSADVAQEIRALLNDAMARINQGSRRAQTAGRSMQEVVAQVGRLNQLIGEVASASSQQSAGARRISQSVSAIDQATQRNVLLVQQSSAAAEAMRLATERMAALMARFRLETGEGASEGELVIDMSR